MSIFPIISSGQDSFALFIPNPTSFVSFIGTTIHLFVDGRVSCIPVFGTLEIRIIDYEQVAVLSFGHYECAQPPHPLAA
jgi:hypothetical protein